MIWQESLERKKSSPFPYSSPQGWGAGEEWRGGGGGGGGEGGGGGGGFFFSCDPSK